MHPAASAPWIPCAAALLLGLPASTPAEGPTGDRFGFSAPEVLAEAGYTRTGARRLPVAAAGYALRYTGLDRPPVDVYVYPVVPDGEELGDARRTERAREEFEQAIADVRTLAERDQRTVELVGEPGLRALTTPEGPLEILSQEMRIGWPSGHVADSHVFVAAKARAVVKVRVSWLDPVPADGPPRPPGTPTEFERAVAEAHVEAFLTAFAAEFLLEGQEGMAGYDHEAARILPIPDNLPESFPFHLPRALPSGWQMQASQPLPEGMGTTAVFRSPAVPGLMQLFLRPFAGSEEDRSDRFEGRWEEELANWVEEIERGLSGEGFVPDEDGVREAEPMELSTHYGPATTRLAYRNFVGPEDRRLETFFAVTSVEEVLVVAVRIHPGIPEAGEGHAVFLDFLGDVAANILATRPPPR